MTGICSTKYPSLEFTENLSKKARLPEGKAIKFLNNKVETKMRLSLADNICTDENENRHYVTSPSIK